MTAIEVLRKYWGYPGFRPLQEEIVNSVAAGHDTLGLMPTGGGKSITFQVPGILSDKLTIVVTPLISLMKDQVDNLRRRRIEAVFFHSAMSRHETTVAWQRITNHRARFLYIAPERIANRRFLDELRHLKVGQIVVDEAHCICQWGYDFRPSYLNIKQLRKLWPDAPVLALTATATPDVADDICRQLEFREGSQRFRMSFSRDNISYIVRPSESKLYDILHILSRTQGSAIVYVRSRKRTREIAEFLQSGGISATFYHAGLDFETKEERQNLWSQGQVRVIVATNAFGMGIDKPDVRVVIHCDLPPSLEEYYQEAGRAGRDGLPSYAVLLPAAGDQSLLRRRVTEAFPPREDILKTYERACTFIGLSIGEGYDTLHDFDLDKFCETFKLQVARTKACLGILSKAGYLEFQEEAENRSRILILCDRDELYDLRFTSKTTDRVLLQILRLYPGLFADYVYINEDRIAREAGLPAEDVYQSLIELSRMKAISYIPRKRTPMLYVPTSREETKYLAIGKSIYEERKKILQERTEAMIDYAYGRRGCRVARMLAYFGETDAAPCGKCDACRDARKRDNAPTREHLLRLVSDFIASAPAGVTVDQLRHSFGFQADDAISALRYLQAEGFVRLTDSRYYPN